MAVLSLPHRRATMRSTSRSKDPQAVPSYLSISEAPTVTVRPQASGRGTAAIDTDGDVYAGDTGRRITITYTAIGQISGWTAQSHRSRWR